MAFLFALLLAVATVGAYAEEPEKLVRGTNARITEFPHMVSIRRNGRHHCGGAIVRNDLILTAAHCVDPLMNDPNTVVTVVVGTDSLVNGGVAYSPALYLKDSRWAIPNTWDYDVGAIKLTTPIPDSPTSRAVRIGSVAPPVGSTITVSAWGSIGKGQPTSAQLQKLDMSVLDQPTCQYSHNYHIWDMQICGFVQRGYGTCEGDSGSPLLYRGELVGVVSGGIPCAEAHPDIFTNLALVKDFIQAAFRA